MSLLGAFIVELGNESIDLDDWCAFARLQAEAAVCFNAAFLQRHQLPLLSVQELGLRYVPTRNVHVDNLRAGLLAQPIRTLPVLLRDRVGSCLDLAPYVAALERCRGREAHVEITRDRFPWHAVVQCPGFTIDPSLQIPPLQ